MDDQYLQLVKSQEINKEYSQVKREFQEKLGYGLNVENIRRVVVEKEALLGQVNQLKDKIREKQDEKSVFIEQKLQMQNENDRILEYLEKVTK